MTPGIRSKGRIPVDHVPLRDGDCLTIPALQLHFQMRIKAGGDLPAEQGEGPAVPDPPDADLLPLLGHSGAGGIQKQNHLIHRVLPAVLKGDRHVHGAVWRKQIPAEVAFGDLLPGRIIEIDACNLRILRRRPAVLMRAVKDPAQRRQQRQAEVIVLGVLGILPPTTSALLHNMSTLAIGLKSMTNLLPESEQNSAN